MEGYKTEIIEGSREFSPIERYQMQDVGDAIQLADIAGDGEVLIDVADYAVVHVNNPHSKDRTEYEKTVILDKAGTKYVTGSNAFLSEFKNIMNTLGGSDGWMLKVYTKPSKNYSGDYITCTVVATK